MKVKSISAGLLFEKKLNEAIQELEKTGKKIISMHSSDDMSMWAISYED